MHALLRGVPSREGTAGHLLSKVCASQPSHKGCMHAQIACAPHTGLQGKEGSVGISFVVPAFKKVSQICTAPGTCCWAGPRKAATHSTSSRCQQQAMPVVGLAQAWCAVTLQAPGLTPHRRGSPTNSFQSVRPDGPQEHGSPWHVAAPSCSSPIGHEIHQHSLRGPAPLKISTPFTRWGMVAAVAQL